MSAHRLTLWSDLACAGGEMLADIDLSDVLDGVAELDLQHHGTLTFRAAEDAPWMDLAETGRVIRLDTATGRTSEWRIAQTEDGSGIDPAVRITCDPAALDLARRCGFLVYRTPGGLTRMAHGAVDLLPRQYIATFLLPSLAHYGVDWIQIGEVESAKPIDLTFERWTPWQLMDALADATGMEWDFRRLGESGYALDLVERIGADAEPVYLSTERNLLRLVRTRDAGDVASAVVMRGGAYGGDGERWGIEHATWRVAARSGNTLTLEAHNDGPGPIAFDGQLVGEYLQKPNGTRTPVLATNAASQQVTVQDASGVNVGDDVVFVEDAAGSLMYELRAPGPLTGVATFTDDSLRGERNYAVNPFFRQFPSEPDAFLGYTRMPSTPTNTLDLTQLPPGKVISAGDLILYCNPGNAFFRRTLRVASGGTVDSSGKLTVTLTMNSPGQFFNTLERILIIKASAGPPTGWDVAPQANNVSTVAYPRPAEGFSVAAVLDGAHPDPGTHQINLRGLPPGMKIPHGTMANTRQVWGPTRTVDGSGKVTLILNGPFSGADGGPVTLSLPDIPMGESGGGITLMQLPMSPIRQTVFLKHYPGMPGLRIGVDFHVSNTSDFADGWDLKELWPKVEIRNETGDSILQSVQYEIGEDEARIPPGQPAIFNLTAHLEITEDTTVQVWIYAGGQLPASSSMVTTVVHSPMVTASPEDTVPAIEGSFGTAIWQEGNRHLVRISEPARVYECSVVDVATMAGFDVQWNELVLGGSLILRDPDRGIAETVRIVGMAINLKDPLDTQLTLDTRPDLETELFERRAGQFVTIGQAAHPTTERPPARLKGAWRAVGRRGVSQPDVLPIEPYRGDA